MVDYKLFKIIINAPRLAKVIINIVVRYHGLPDFIVTIQRSVLTLKFWSCFYYLFDIKKQLSIIFYPQTDGHIKRQNSTMKAYFKAFVNFEENDWVKLPPIAKFAYSNTNNVSISHMLFELNYGYYPQVSYKEDIDIRSKFNFAKSCHLSCKSFC